MHTRATTMHRLATLSLLLLPLTACDPQASSPGTVPTQPTATGKADGAAAVEFVAASEKLGSKALRRTLCDAIVAAQPWGSGAERDAFDGDCLDHSFVITEFAVSKLFAHLDDGDPVTMQMRVSVEADGKSWETRLVREQSGFEFVWTGAVDNLPDVDARDAFIADVADEVGEFFQPDDFPEFFRPLGDFDDLPQDVSKAVTLRVAEIDAAIRQDETDPSFADLTDEPPFEIIDDGEVVGYAISVGFFIEHPLFDGGGTTLYVNVLGEIVAEIDWFG